MEPITAAKTSAGWWKRFATFWKDFGAVPGNLKKLAAAQEADADKRLICLSCGTGRVGDLAHFTPQGAIMGGTRGRCNQCGTVWWIDVPAHALKAPCMDQHWAGSP